MAKYLSNKFKSLKIGLDGFSENKTSLTIIGNVGVGATLSLNSESGIVNAVSFKRHGGTSSEFLMADGSINNSTFLTAESDTLDSILTRGNTTTKNLTVGDITADNISVGGTITYDDVTSVDSLGIVTARSGIYVGPINAGVATITADGNATFSGIITSGQLNVTDTLNVSGVSTFIGDIEVKNTSPKLLLTDTNANSDYSVHVENGTFHVRDETNSENRIRVESDGTIQFKGDVNVTGITTLSETDINGDLSLKKTINTQYSPTTVSTPIVTIRNDASLNNSFSGLRLQAHNVNAAAAAFNISVLNGSTNYKSTLVLQSRDTENDHSEKLRIADTGNIGIGITQPINPGHKTVHIHESASNQPVRIHMTTVGTGATAGDGFSLSIDGSNKDVNLIQRESADMRFYTAEVEKLRITSDGEVGINTSNPQGDLQIGTGVTIYGNSGIVSATKFIGDGSDLTGVGVGTDGSINTTGIITATTLSGDSLMVGAASTPTGNGTFNPAIQQIGTDSASSSLNIFRFSNDTSAASIRITKSRSTNPSSLGIVQQGDQIGNIYFLGDDGDNLNSGAARILAKVTGTPESGFGMHMPLSLSFWTAPDGGGIAQERLTVYHDGNVGINRTVPTEKLDVDGTVKATTFSGSGTSLTNLPAGQLSGVLPALDGSALTGVGVGTDGSINTIGIITAASFSGSGVSLTNLPAEQLTGTVADARISTLSASKLTGDLPVISGANLTDVLTTNVGGDVGNLTVAGIASVGIGTTGDSFTGKVDLFHEGELRLKTTPAGVQVVGLLSATSLDFTGAEGAFNEDLILKGASANAKWDKSESYLQINDGAKVVFGSDVDSGDLEIYHSGNHSYINEDGTGELLITTGIGTTAAMVSDGSITLYHQGTERLKTTASGVTINGTISGSISGTINGNAATATDLEINAAQQLVLQTGNNATDVLASGTAGYILQSNGSGNAPTWAAAAPANAISGITLREDGGLVGSANSISTINFTGAGVGVTFTNPSAGIATVTIAGGGGDSSAVMLSMIFG